MSDSPSSKLQRRAIGLLDYQTRIDEAVAAGHLWKADGPLSITTAVIRFAYELEHQLESHFVYLVRGKTLRSGSGPRMKYSSDIVLRDHLLQDRRYVDWLPYDQTEKRAKLFLRGGRPFTELSIDGRKAFRELSAIRNVLAHESNHAAARFEKVVLSSRVVPSYERKVERYLKGEHSTGVSRLENHMNECIQAFKELV